MCIYCYTQEATAACVMVNETISAYQLTSYWKSTVGHCLSGLSLSFMNSSFVAISPIDGGYSLECIILLGPVAQSEASPAVHQGFVSSIETQPKSIISWRLVRKTDIYIYKYVYSPPSADSRRVLVRFK